MKEQKFSIKKRIRSFKYAFNGIKILCAEEHNTWIHIAVALMVIGIGSLLHVSSYEWILLVFAIGFVLTTETLNSAIENMADFVSPEWHKDIKRIKDLAAASVLISAATATVIGLIIFVPKTLQLC